MRQDILFGESLDSVIYCGHLSFVMRLKLHLTSFGQNIDDEVQAASGYCISFVYRDYGHYLSGTFGNGYLRIGKQWCKTTSMRIRWGATNVISQLSTYRYLQLLLV